MCCLEKNIRSHPKHAHLAHKNLKISLFLSTDFFFIYLRKKGLLINPNRWYYYQQICFFLYAKILKLLQTSKMKSRWFVYTNQSILIKTSMKKLQLTPCLNFGRDWNSPIFCVCVCVRFVYFRRRKNLMGNFYHIVCELLVPFLKPKILDVGVGVIGDVVVVGFLVVRLVVVVGTVVVVVRGMSRTVTIKIWIFIFGIIVGFFNFSFAIQIYHWNILLKYRESLTLRHNSTRTNLSKHVCQTSRTSKSLPHSMIYCLLIDVPRIYFRIIQKNRLETMIPSSN